MNYFIDIIEEELIKSYEKMVIEEIESEFQSEDKSSKIVYKGDDNRSPKHSHDNFYYRHNVLDTIFDKVTMYLEKGELYTVPIPGETTYSWFRIMTLSTGVKGLGCGDEIAIKELRLRIQKLLSSADIQNLVKKYHELVDMLNRNEKANRFYTSIKNIWASIDENHVPLKGEGSCNECPKKSYLSYF